MVSKTILIFLVALFSFELASVASAKTTTTTTTTTNANPEGDLLNEEEETETSPPELLTTTSGRVSDSTKYEENLKCTEHKGRVSPDYILHVPCLLIRLVEHLKHHCPVDSIVDTFLSIQTYIQIINEFVFRFLHRWLKNNNTDIRCSEKCTSGSLKKDVNRVRERIVSSVRESFELEHARLVGEARRLAKQLLTSPANFTENNNNNKKLFRAASAASAKQPRLFECRTYAYALRQYFIDTQSEHSIRRYMLSGDEPKPTHRNRKQHQHMDASLPLDQSSIDKRIGEFRCRPTIRTDRSIFFYFKYLVESLK